MLCKDCIAETRSSPGPVALNADDGHSAGTDDHATSASSSSAALSTTRLDNRVTPQASLMACDSFPAKRCTFGLIDQASVETCTSRPCGAYQCCKAAPTESPLTTTTLPSGGTAKPVEVTLPADRPTTSEDDSPSSSVSTQAHTLTTTASHIAVTSQLQSTGASVKSTTTTSVPSTPSVSVAANAPSTAIQPHLFQPSCADASQDPGIQVFDCDGQMPRLTTTPCEGGICSFFECCEPTTTVQITTSAAQLRSTRPANEAGSAPAVTTTAGAQPLSTTSTSDAIPVRHSIIPATTFPPAQRPHGTAAANGMPGVSTTAADRPATTAVPSEASTTDGSSASASIARGSATSASLKDSKSIAGSARSTTASASGLVVSTTSSKLSSMSNVNPTPTYAPRQASTSDHAELEPTSTTSSSWIATCGDTSAAPGLQQFDGCLGKQLVTGARCNPSTGTCAVEECCTPTCTDSVLDTPGIVFDCGDRQPLDSMAAIACDQGQCTADQCCKRFEPSCSDISEELGFQPFDCISHGLRLMDVPFRCEGACTPSDCCQHSTTLAADQPDMALSSLTHARAAAAAPVGPSTDPQEIATERTTTGARQQTRQAL